MITPSTRFYGLRMNLRSATRDRNHETRRSEAQPLWEPRSRTDRAAEQAGALAVAAGGARDAADRAQAPGGADHLDLVAAASLGAVEGGVGGRHEVGVRAPAGTARAASAVVPRSQAAAFISPVLESVLASLTSCACKADRCSKVASGRAIRAVSRLIAIASVDSTAMHISVRSLRSVLRPNMNSRSRVAGVVALTAAKTKDLFTATCTTAQAATSTIQVVTREPSPRPVPRASAGPGPSARWPRPWKVSDAPP